MPGLRSTLGKPATGVSVHPMLFRFCALFAVVSFTAGAAQINFNWSQDPLGRAPTNFVSRLSGGGSPGDWKLVTDDVPPLLAPINPNAPVPKRTVLAQLSTDKADERFPLLVYEGETFKDFTLKTRFKTVAGTEERMAGIAFRIVDEKNYYVIRASSLGNNLRFYKFVNGERSAPIGPEMPIPGGVWHQLTIEARGNELRFLLNDKEAMPFLTDNSFPAGKFGFWTKSDSVSHFVDTTITYKPIEPETQVAVRQIMKARPKSLLGLKLFAYDGSGTNSCRIIASDKESEVGQPGGASELDVLKREKSYFAKGSDRSEVTVPIRDRNGEVIAAARLVMPTFFGQTEKNALERAMPIRGELELLIQASRDLE